MKKLFLSFILFSTLTFSQDAIEVSPSTLDFGNVLMGNTPSLTFQLFVILIRQLRLLLQVFIALTSLRLL